MLAPRQPHALVAVVAPPADVAGAEVGRGAVAVDALGVARALAAGRRHDVAREADHVPVLVADVAVADLTSEEMVSIKMHVLESICSCFD